MRSFYDSYNVLLLELSLDEVASRMDSDKFKRIFRGNGNEMDSFRKYDYEKMKDTIIKSLPDDISESVAKMVDKLPDLSKYMDFGY